MKGLDQKLPSGQQDPRHRELDAKRHEHAAEIRRLADLWNKTAIIEDGVYRFYHQSFKVANLLAVANDVYALLGDLCPAGCQLNPWFVEIAEDAEHAWTSAPDLQTRNTHWSRHARPVAEFAFHCDYFLDQLVQYETVEFASLRQLPFGVAAVLELYGIR
jgi:hypothetical protein